MFKTLARILLLRVLPRRILPVVTLVEAVLFVRGIRNRSRLKVDPPSVSNGAPPMRPAADWGVSRSPDAPDGPQPG